MKQKCRRTETPLSSDNTTTAIPIFPGIQLNYLSFSGKYFPIHHKNPSQLMEIHYCKSGRMRWKLEDGSYVYLGAGDFAAHAPEFCMNSRISLLSENYEGLLISIDLKIFTENPPEFLKESGITGFALYENLFQENPFVFFSGAAQTNTIFQFFFNQPETALPVYQKIKTLELLLYLYHTKTFSHQHVAKYQADQIEIIRQLHEDLLDHLDRRITIEELARQYLINPTTMKALFKSVYGTSIAAHMKKHRMEKASQMLLESDRSIADIALAVGYDSQSKFSTAFKEFYQVLPKEYRKKC